MQVQQMNRVQRRLWRVLIQMGVDTGDLAVAVRLDRLLAAHVSVMTPALRHVMPSVLSGTHDVDYVRLAREIVALEGVRISPAALRKRVSRAVKQLERAIGEARWEPPERVPHLDLSGRPPAPAAETPTATKENTEPDPPPKATDPVMR